MPSINFIGGEKGGVGKSVLARVLAQYFIDKGRAFTGFDTDRSHTSFTRFYSDFASPVVVDTYEGLDLVAAVYEEEPAEGPPPNVIVDLAAQTVTRPDGKVYHFEVDAFRKHCLLNGLDDIGLTLQDSDAIKTFESTYQQRSPWLFGAIK